MNLYVGNLNPETSAASLRTLFSEFGEVVSSKVIMDNATGMSRGFGFVEMADKLQAQSAIDNLDVAFFEGNIISVKEAKQNTTGGRPGGNSGGGNRSFKPRTPRPGGYNSGGYNNNSNYNSGGGYNNSSNYNNNRGGYSSGGNYNNSNSNSGYNSNSNSNTNSTTNTGSNELY